MLKSNLIFVNQGFYICKQRNRILLLPANFK
jgi:hypothetical protein